MESFDPSELECVKIYIYKYIYSFSNYDLVPWGRSRNAAQTKWKVPKLVIGLDAIAKDRALIVDVIFGQKDFLDIIFKSFKFSHSFRITGEIVPSFRTHVGNVLAVLGLTYV